MLQCVLALEVCQVMRDLLDYQDDANWNTQSSHGQILALAGAIFSKKVLDTFLSCLTPF